VFTGGVSLISSILSLLVGLDFLEGVVEKGLDGLGIGGFECSRLIVHRAEFPGL
jgi:hypothetical protein